MRGGTAELARLGKEWILLTEQAQKVRDRKRGMREVIEPLFSSIIPRMNRELKMLGVWYYFDHTQHAGYHTDGNIIFSLHPGTVRAWKSKDPWELYVDWRRARELTKLVHQTRALREFHKMFPLATVTVEHNFSGHEKPLPSIRSILRREKLKRK